MFHIFNLNKYEDLIHFDIECPMYKSLKPNYLNKYLSNKQTDIITSLLISQKKIKHRKSQ